MALLMNASTSAGTCAAVLSSDAGVAKLKAQASVNSVPFGNGAVAFKRATLMVVRAEGTSTPPGSDEFPLGVISSTAPLAQGTDKPVGERIAYVCQDCGYVYDEETPFEDVPDEYNCPQCQAPKMRFMMANASVEEMLDTTKEDDAVTRGSGEKSGSPPSQS